MTDSWHTALAGLLALMGIGSPDAVTYQGYGEGEYVLVAPQLSGTVDTLEVKRGQTVHKGDALFTLEHGAEQAAVDQAKAQLAHDEETMIDLLKAKRQPELDQLIASRDEANANLNIAEITFARDQKQIATHAVSQATLDADQAARDQARAKLAEAEAALATGKLSTGRDDAILAAQATVGASRAALAAAEWRLNQKSLTSPTDAFVFDTLFRVGEYANAGQAVVSLLPASNIRVRFFVPGTDLPKLAAGAPVTINETGSMTPIPAHITYIAPQAEYSPPELYNRDNREKLLYMLEATPDAMPERVHPGQPVDVVMPKASSSND